MLRMGIVGTGRIAQRFAQTIKEIEDIELVGVCNPHQESAKHFADTWQLSFFTDSLLCLCEKVDGVYIASPHGTHAAYTREVLLQRKHVLCEKPMALSKENAEELFALAKMQGCVLMEALKTAYCEGFLAMTQLAESGKIGKIRDVEACFSRLTPNHLRELTDQEYGGSLLEFGSYTFLPIVSLLGADYRDISFQSIWSEKGVDIYTKAVLTYDQGFALSKTGLQVKSEGQLIIAGSKGYILAKSPWWLTKEFEVHYEDPNQVEQYRFAFDGSGLQYEMKAFAEAVSLGDKKKLEKQQQVSVATAGIMEAYLKWRGNSQQSLNVVE